MNDGLAGVGYTLVTDPMVSLSTLYLAARFIYYTAYSLRSAAT